MDTRRAAAVARKLAPRLSSVLTLQGCAWEGRQRGEIVAMATIGEERRLIQLGKKAWEDLYDQVFVIALRMTHTRDPSQRATQADRAQEATQRAFDRCWRVRPANLSTLDELRNYLVWGVRSELSNVSREAASRREHEARAAVEASAVAGAMHASAEVISIEVAAAKRRRERAVRALKRLREDLAGDPISLGTVDCLEKGVSRPAEQARILGCTVDEIHAARKRRNRALERILDAMDAEGDEEKA